MEKLKLMAKGTICKQCKFKSYSETTCPKCGSNLRSKTTKPKTHIRPFSKKRRAVQDDMVDAMREFVRTQPKRCSHCGLPIKAWKFGNVDHIVPKSQAPEKIADPDNFQVLCDDVDVMYSDKVCQGEMSCHGIKHRGTQKQWDAKAGKYSQE